MIDMNYLLISDPSLLLKSTLNQIINEALPFKDELNCIDVDFENTSLDEIIDQLQTPSFNSEKKVVIAKNPYFFSDEKKKLPFENNLKLLDEYLQNPNQDSIFVIICSQQYYLPKNKYFQLVKKYSQVQNLLFENQEDLKNYAITLKEKLGLSFDADAFQLFLNRCTNVSTLEREITKLSLYGQDLDYESVDQLVSRPLEDNVFDLSNAILKKDKQKTMKLYDDLKKIKTEPIQLIALLAKQFRFLLQVKILKNEKYSNEQIANELNAHPYRVKIALDNCRQFSLKEIKTKLLKLADLDLSIKKGLKDRYIDFEIFLMTD